MISIWDSEVFDWQEKIPYIFVCIPPSILDIFWIILDIPLWIWYNRVSTLTEIDMPKIKGVEIVYDKPYTDQEVVYGFRRDMTFEQAMLATRIIHAARKIVPMHWE